MKRPHLVPQWRQVLNRAWSSRLALLGGLLAGGGMALPVFSDFFTHGQFLFLCMACCIGAVLARIVDQPKLRDKVRGDDGP